MTATPPIAARRSFPLLSAIPMSAGKQRAERPQTEEARMAYTAIATTTAGRNGHVESSDGTLKLDLAMPGSGKAGTNPEQLFAAGYSSCFGSAIQAVAGASKTKLDAVHVTAEVTLVIEGHDYSIAVKLKAKIEGVSHEEAEKLVHEAHKVCPYSKATRGNIPVELEVL
jgi:osmotically inducible protein OsmC